MKRLLTILQICCVMTGAASSVSVFADEAAKTNSATAGIRVGTFDSRLVATAYVRSDPFHQRLAEMHAELEAAKASNDEKRVKQLEANGAALQHLIHKQGFSTWPVHDILQTIKEELPRIAKQADVDLIVSKWDVVFQGRSVEAVDVTDLMVAPFHPNEETKKVLESLRRKTPVPLGQLNKHK